MDKQGQGNLIHIQDEIDHRMDYIKSIVEIFDFDDPRITEENGNKILEQVRKMYDVATEIESILG